MSAEPRSGKLHNNFLVEIVTGCWKGSRSFLSRRNALPGIGNTDHLSFIRVGVPGFNVIQEYGDYDVCMHHTNVDTFERVREADLQQNAIASYRILRVEVEFIPAGD